MKLLIQERELLIKLRARSLYHRHIIEYITKHFENPLQLSNAYILTADPQERRKRQIFLHWIYALYQKQNPKILPSFQRMLFSKLNHTIRVKVIDPKQIVSQLVLQFHIIGQDRLRIRFNSENTMILNYLKLIFKKSVSGTSLDLLTLEIKASSNAIMFIKLTELIQRDKLLNIPIAFRYDTKSLSAFYQRFGCHFERRKSINETTKKEQELLRCYFVLGANRKESLDEIKPRYRKLIKQYHPDKVNNDPLLKPLYTRRFQMIQNAYETIRAHQRAS